MVSYKGAHASRPDDEVDVDTFVGIKSHRAKGKRITTYDVASLTFVEPEPTPEPEEPETPEVDAAEDIDDAAVGAGYDDPDGGDESETEQLNLF